MAPDLLTRIAKIGQQHKSGPSIARIKLFNNYFDNDSNLKIDELAEPDGNCTRRELLARFLLLNAVLDQGPDMEGVRQLLCDTLNVLYGEEIPFDSNAGRVLFRSGYLLRYATIEDYVKYNVIQRGKGRNGKDYIRVTNIRDKRATKNLKEVDYETYSNLCVNHLRTHVRRPIRAKYEIQKIPLAQLLEGRQFVTGKFDDGLMYIGTNHCFNHDAPKCLTCPINDLCVGRRDKTLIEKYRT